MLRRRWLVPLLAVVAVLTAVTAVVVLRSSPGVPRTTTIPPGRPAPTTGEVQRLAGRWVRPDGGYVLEIRHVATDGRLDVAYFNPSPIHVAQARVRTIDGPIEVFVELRDTNYPGATYRLVYEPRDDALFGVYTQPAVGQTFDVTFVRLR